MYGQLYRVAIKEPNTNHIGTECPIASDVPMSKKTVHYNNKAHQTALVAINTKIYTRPN